MIRRLGDIPLEVLELGRKLNIHTKHTEEVTSMKIVIEELTAEYLFQEFDEAVGRDIETINRLLAGTKNFKPFSSKYGIIRLLRQRNYRIVVARDKSRDRFKHETILGIGWGFIFETLTGRVAATEEIVTREDFRQVEPLIREKIETIAQDKVVLF